MTPSPHRSRSRRTIGRLVVALVATMTTLALPAAPANAASSTFHARLGKGVRVSCMIEWLPNTDSPGEIRCDRFRTVNGTSKQDEGSYVVRDGRKGKRVFYTDTIGDRAGFRLYAGKTVTRGKFLHCKAKSDRIRCWDSWFDHGFVVRRNGYSVF